MTDDAAIRATPASNAPATYDALEIACHWATVLLVVVLYLLGQFWGFAPRGPARAALHTLHVELGLALILVLAVRIAWRLGPGRRLPPADRGLVAWAAQAMYYALYALLIIQVCLGIPLRWAEQDPLSVFGLFTIPNLPGLTKQSADAIGEWHELVANLIILLAGLHALAALFHHFVLRDGVLRRMLPWLAPPR